MRRFFTKVVYVQVAMGMVAYCLADYQPGLALLAPVLCLGSWFLVDSKEGRPLPRGVVNLMVVLATGWLFYRQLTRQGPLISGLGYYILFLQLCKLFERKSGRDWSQLIILSLMQMVCAAILSNQFIFAVLLVSYLPLGMISALMYQLIQGRDQFAASARKQCGGERMPSFPAATQAGGSPSGPKDFATVAVGVGGAALVLSALLFVLLPRGRSAGLLGRFSRSRVTQVGYASKVRLTGNQTLAQNNEPVMHVRLSRNGRDIGGPGHFFRLRGMALDYYNPILETWERKQTVRQDYRLQAREPVDLLDPPAETSLVRQQVTLLVPTEDSLFAMHPPARISVPGRVGWNPHDQVLRYLDSRALSEPYWVESLERGNTPSLVGRYRRAMSSRGFGFSSYARGPVLDGETGRRIGNLATSILQEQGLSRPLAADQTPEDHQIAKALEQYLQNNYSYTLSLPSLPRGRDPIEAFLFNTRAGHCQYFASSLCAMLRSLGMRARVVTGFQVTEFNEVGGYYVVRQKNAHAWVEAWTAEGWVPYDPSPPADIEQLHRPEEGFFSKARRWYEYLEYQWINHVITFDKTQQGGLGDWFKNAWGSFLEAVRRWATGGGWFGPMFWVAAVGLVGLGAFLLRHRRRWRDLTPDKSMNASERQTYRKQIAFYVRALDRLRRAGIRRRPHQTPGAFARAAAAQDPERFGPIQPLTDLYYQIRFGGRRLDPESLRRAEELVEQLGQAP
ncbi:MAG: DUF3488 and transglutaminase-like domain-containing protein [Phycisphaeraceae bacterium]|nr:DUF3488 and transglutaminase-like domain-containing protein [Phycisphaeraceae bacterium]